MRPYTAAAFLFVRWALGTRISATDDLAHAATRLEAALQRVHDTRATARLAPTDQSCRALDALFDDHAVVASANLSMPLALLCRFWHFMGAAPMRTTFEQRFTAPVSESGRDDEAALADRIARRATVGWLVRHEGAIAPTSWRDALDGGTCSFDTRMMMWARFDRESGKVTELELVADAAGLPPCGDLVEMHKRVIDRYYDYLA